VETILIGVLNNTMMLKTAEVFISKFLDSAWAKLSKQIGNKINAEIEG